MRDGPLSTLISLPIFVSGIPTVSLCRSLLCCSSLTSLPIFSRNLGPPTSLSLPLWLAAEQLARDCFPKLVFCSQTLTETDLHDAEQPRQLSARSMAGQLAREQHYLTCL
jgi:hypothetical protein